MIAAEKPQLPRLPKLQYGEGTFAYTDTGTIALKKKLKDSEMPWKIEQHPESADLIRIMDEVFASMKKDKGQDIEQE